MVFEQKPILLISSRHELDMIATRLYLRKCIKRTYDVIPAEEATGHLGRASPEEILEHLKEYPAKYSAILVSKPDSDQIPEIKKVIGNIPLICYGVFSEEERRGLNVPCASLIPQNELGEILNRELSKR